MRKVNRVVRLLVLGGVGSIALSVLSAVTNAASWLGLLFTAIGMGLLFVARHFYLRLPVAMPVERQKPVARQPFAPFVATHRRQLNALAQIGLALSLFRLVGLCFGSNWPGPWGAWGLGAGSFALACIAPKWPESCPKWVGWILRIYWQGLILSVTLVVIAYSDHRPWPAMQQTMNIFLTGLFVLFYGGAAVGFARGEIRLLSVDSAE